MKMSRYAGTMPALSGMHFTNRKLLSAATWLAAVVAGEAYSISASFLLGRIRPAEVFMIDDHARRLGAGQIGSLKASIDWHGWLFVVMTSLALFAIVAISGHLYFRLIGKRPEEMPYPNRELSMQAIIA